MPEEQLFLRKNNSMSWSTFFSGKSKPPPIHHPPPSRQQNQLRARNHSADEFPLQERGEAAWVTAGGVWVLNMTRIKATIQSVNCSLAFGILKFPTHCDSSN